MEDVTRWVGLVVTFVGALAINPSSQCTSSMRRARRSAEGCIDRAGSSRVSFLGCVRTSLCRSMLRHVAFAGGEVEISGRGLVGWGSNSTVEDKIDVLDSRTRVLHEEVEFPTDVAPEGREGPPSRADRSVESLRSELREIQGSLEVLRQEGIRMRASALPVIVIGVLLSGLSPEAAILPVWLWFGGIGGVCGSRAVLVSRIVRQYRAATR